MIVYYYDKTFEGLLSALYDAYFRKNFPERLLGEGEPPPLFAEIGHTVHSTPAKADRVWKGLEKKLSGNMCHMIVYAWLSEIEGSDELLFRYMRKVFDSPRLIATDFADDDVLEVKKIAQKVAKEKQYIIQFVRFQKAADDTFFAGISPQYNALPLAIDHFKVRFADQKWIIYDLKRKYGYYYDLKELIEITPAEEDFMKSGMINEELMAEDEKLFQQRWKAYFKALLIKERINPKLHRQHMPRRFWKYLTEKQ